MFSDQLMENIASFNAKFEKSKANGNLKKDAEIFYEWGNRLVKGFNQEKLQMSKNNGVYLDKVDEVILRLNYKEGMKVKDHVDEISKIV
jgi:hypothetical protein